MIAGPANPQMTDRHAAAPQRTSCEPIGQPGAATIDSHAHVFHRGLSFDGERRYTPDYDAPLDVYLRELDTHGMSNGVLVQPSFLGTDNGYLVECLAAAHGRLRGIAVVDPAIPPSELAALDDAGIVGIRLNLVGRPLPDFGSPAWASCLAEVARLGWQIEVQRSMRDLAILAPQLLATGANVVLDHFALPDPSLGADDPALAAILKAGATRRLWVKVSGAYRSGPAGEAIARELYPRLREGLGIDRLMWGSDWPHTQFEPSQSYDKSVACFESFVPSAAERATILASPRSLMRF